MRRVHRAFVRLLLLLGVLCAMVAGSPAAHAQEAGGIIIESDPTEADVYIDGRHVGRTPYGPADMTPGQYAVCLRKPAYQEWCSTATVRARVDWHRSPTLARASPGPSPSLPTGLLILESIPAGAVVVLNGREVGKTPIHERVPAGTHYLRLSLAGYQEYVQEKLEVREGSERRLKILLVRVTTGRLIIESDPPGATVVLDRVPVGKTPFRQEAFQGLHQLRLFLPGYREHVEEAIGVAVDKETRLVIPLRPVHSWSSGILRWGAILVGVLGVAWLLWRRVVAPLIESTSRPRRVTCPHCGRSSDRRELRYGCRHCREEDGRRHLFPATEAGECDQCGRFAQDTVCPKCFEPITGVRGVAAMHAVAVVGPSESGKSFYVTALVHTLWNRPPHLLGSPVGVQLETDSLNLYEKRLRQLDEGIIKHVQGDLPESFQMWLTLRRRPPVGVVLYDIQGHVFDSPRTIARSAPHLAEVSGIILMVPADQLRQTQAGAERSRETSASSSPQWVLNNVLNYFQDEVPSRVTERLADMPIAIVVSKVDTRVDFPPSHKGSRVRATLTGSFDLGNLEANTQRFRRCEYFAVQAATGSEGRLLASLDLLDPLLWILRQVGALPREGLVARLCAWVRRRVISAMGSLRP